MTRVIGISQQVAQDSGGVDNMRCGHRGDPFERAVKGDFEPGMSPLL